MYQPSTTTYQETTYSTGGSAYGTGYGTGYGMGYGAEYGTGYGNTNLNLNSGIAGGAFSNLGGDYMTGTFTSSPGITTSIAEGANLTSGYGNYGMGGVGGGYVGTTFPGTTSTVTTTKSESSYSTGLGGGFNTPMVPPPPGVATNITSTSGMNANNIGPIGGGSTTTYTS